MATKGPLIRGRIDCKLGNTGTGDDWKQDLLLPLPGVFPTRIQNIFPVDREVIRVTWDKVPGGFIQMSSDPVLISVLAGGLNQDSSVEYTQTFANQQELNLAATFYEVAP